MISYLWSLISALWFRPQAQPPASHQRSAVSIVSSRQQPNFYDAEAEGWV
jgi:hypothetical protein